MVEPDYYIKNGLSPLQAFEQGLLSKEQYVGFCKGNVIKYTIRAGEKHNDPLMDIVKAMDYLHHLHKALKTEPETNNDDDVYVVGDLDEKLDEVKENIEDFKRDYNINTHLRPKKVRDFPTVDTNLRHNESLTGTSKSNWLTNLKNTIKREL